jgi:hypothetical protein
MSAHTPGPWKLTEQSTTCIYIRADVDAKRGRRLCCVYLGTDADKPQALADAQLIAAAPDLLEALRELSSWQYEQDKYVRIARAAIAKATEE